MESVESSMDHSKQISVSPFPRVISSPEQDPFRGVVSVQVVFAGLPGVLCIVSIAVLCGKTTQMCSFSLAIYPAGKITPLSF